MCMNKTKNLKERILSIVLTLSMVVSLFAGMAPVEAQAANYSYDATENSEFSIYEPLILNSTTLNASTVWASGDREFTMDADGGFFSSAKPSSGAFPDDGKITTSDDVPYQLAWTGSSPYAGNDSIRFVGMRSDSNVTSNPVTMKLSTYGVYDNVYVLGTAGGFEDNTKSLNFSVKLTYADNTTSTTTYNLYDWYINAEVLKNHEIGYSVFKRLNRDSSTIDKLNLTPTP